MCSPFFSKGYIFSRCRFGRKGVCMKLSNAIFVFTVALGFAVSSAGELVDSRDGQVYRTIKVGNIEWMAQNMNHKTKESLCYKKNKQNCTTYGRLYSWDDAMGAACPDGWNLPSIDDVNALLKTVGGEEVAATALKAKDGWFGGGNGLDNIGFSALPGGSVSNKGVFDGEKKEGGFWSSDEAAGAGVAVLQMNYFGKNVQYAARRFNPRYGFSVRCVRGSSFGATDADGNDYRAVKIGKQIWTAENMKVNLPGSRCYNDDSLNCEKYGRLYTWEAANQACPAGWHLPSTEEFAKLRYFVYNSNGVEYGDVGYSLKAREAWETDDYQLSQPLDIYGFKALPAGRLNASDNFVSLGGATSFWTSSKDSDYGPIGWHLDSFIDNFEANTDGKMLSVRCLMD